MFLLQHPQIILMKEGTDSSQGKPQLISNINACSAVVDAIRTTLGPRGMDKLIVDPKVAILSQGLFGYMCLKPFISLLYWVFCICNLVYKMYVYGLLVCL